MGRANDRELNDRVLVATTADSATWAAVPESDVYLLRSYVVANLRLFDTAYLQIEQNLLGADALERLGWTGLLESTLLARMWPHVRPMVSREFADYLEAEQPRLQGD